MVVEEIIIYGAVQGAVYALLALGYSLVYGVGGILNLAHGAYYLLATYAFYITWDELDRSASGFYWGMIMAVIVATIIVLSGLKRNIKAKSFDFQFAVSDIFQLI